MCRDDGEKLTFETMLADPMLRLMMEADRVSVAEMRELLLRAGEAKANHEREALAS